MSWWRPAFGLLVLPLTGCLSDQKHQVAQCVFDSRQHYSPEDQSRPYDRGLYIKQCVEAGGYEFTYRDKQCEPDVFAHQYESPYCYQPYGKLGQWALRVEIAWERWN